MKKKTRNDCLSRLLKAMRDEDNKQMRTNMWSDIEALRYEWKEQSFANLKSIYPNVFSDVDV